MQAQQQRRFQMNCTEPTAQIGRIRLILVLVCAKLNANMSLAKKNKTTFTECLLLAPVEGCSCQRAERRTHVQARGQPTHLRVIRSL